MDPLAGDFPAWSPYNYVMGNPVSLLDPDGRAPEIVLPEDPGDRRAAERMISELSRTSTGRALVDKLEASETKVFIIIGGSTNGRTEGSRLLSSNEVDLYVNPDKVSASERGNIPTPFEASIPSDIGTMSHEMQHASDMIEDPYEFSGNEKSAHSYRENVNEIEAESTRVKVETEYSKLNRKIEAMPLEEINERI